MKKIFISIIVIILLISIAITTLFTISGYNMYKEAISREPIDIKIAEIRNKDNYTSLNDITTIYKNAVVAVEDHRFYKHKGVDYIAVARATAKNIVSKDFVEGGSTITQQLAKNTYFSFNKEINRKFAEAFVAKEFEKKLSKDEILELYINCCYFGDGYYDIITASKGYFNKLPSELNEFEATLLAGVPNAPSVYSPTVNYDLATKRQKKVLSDMVKYGYISDIKKNEIIGQTENYRKYFKEKNAKEEGVE